MFEYNQFMNEPAIMLIPTTTITNKEMLMVEKLVSSFLEYVAQKNKLPAKFKIIIEDAMPPQCVESPGGDHLFEYKDERLICVYCKHESMLKSELQEEMGMGLE